MNHQQTSTNIEAEKAELLNKCYQLLKKIANRPYSIKLLVSAIHALETIAGYKENRIDPRRQKPKQSPNFELIIPPKKNE